MRILLDHNVPRPLKDSVPGHIADTAADRNWQELRNGELLDRAESEGYELFITADQKIRFQQNFVGRSIRVLILPTNSWPMLRQHLTDISEAINAPHREQISQLLIG